MAGLKALVSSIISMPYFFGIILMIVAFGSIFIGSKSTKDFLKHLFFNMSAIFLVLGMYEMYLFNLTAGHGHESALEVKGRSADPYMIYDEKLGYQPNADGIFHAVRTSDREIIYDVNYTIKNRLRNSPNSNDSSSDCALFFGCSVTFGEGLSDDKTLPYFFNEYNDRRYRLLNYGLHGYGPHQMLAQIESRLSADISHSDGHKVAIYSMMLFHIRRAAGYTLWDRFGPNYVLDQGKAVREGAFSKRREGLLPKTVMKLLSSSKIYQKFFIKVNHKPSKYDIDRAIAIVKQSNELLSNQGVKLHILLNDIDEHATNDIGEAESYQYFLAELQKTGVTIFYLHDIIEDYYAHIDKYTLHKLDRHPNALANEIVAKYLAMHME